MTTICGMRIIFGRYLALYRWNLLHQAKPINVENFISQEIYQKSFLSTYNYIHPLFKPNQQKNKENRIQNAPVSKSDKILHKPIKKDLFAGFFSKTSIYDSRTKICMNKKYISIMRKSEYRFLLRIKSNSELQLKSYSVIFPKEVSTYINPQIGHILQKFTSILSNIVSKSLTPIESCQKALHRFYLFGLNSYILSIFIKYQNKYNYKCYENGYNSTLIVFPELFSPSNEFILAINDTEISLFSKTVLFGGFLSYNFSNSTSLLDPIQIESIISEMQLKVCQTKISRLYASIRKSVSILNVSQFKSDLDLTTLRITFTTFTIPTCILTVTKLNGHSRLDFHKSSDPLLFEGLIGFIEKGYRTDHCVRVIYLHSLVSLFCNFSNLTIQTDLFNPEKSPYLRFSQLLFYSSCSAVATRIVQHDGRPFFMLETIRDESQMKNFVGSLSIDVLSTINVTIGTAPTADVMNGIKVIAVLAQFAQELRERGISATIDYDKVIFIIEPFDSVVFKMSSELSWSLKFIRPSFMTLRCLSFSGCSVNSRFVVWLVELLMNVSRILHLYRQALVEYKISNVIEKLDFFNASELSLSFDSNYETDNEEFNNNVVKSDSNNVLYISFQPILDVQNLSNQNMDNMDQSLYSVHPFITPRVQFTFSQFIPLKHQLNVWLKSGQILLLFGSFIKCSLKPLLYFYRLFSCHMSSTKYKQKSNWSMTPLRDDGSFFLIFQRKLSINFMLRPSQVFQLIIPSVGKSQMLQVPLEALPRPCHLSKLSHPAMKLHINQLQKFKSIIENFFEFHERLIEIGFENFELVNNEVISLFPRHISYATISCIIRPTYVEFRVEGDSEVAQNLSMILNFQYKDNETQILIVRVVISLLDFDQKFVSFVMRFMAVMAAKTESFGIEWKRTMEMTSVILSEMKVLFNFKTAKDQFCVELAKNSKDSTTQIMCYDDMGNMAKLKVMKDLVNWIQKRENGDV